MNNIVWKRINSNTLSRYEISSLKKVRIITTKLETPSLFDNTLNEEYVMLFVNNNNRERFTINELMAEAFSEELRIDKKGEYIPYLSDSSDTCFSKDEDNYGLGINKVHWNELRELIHLLKLKGKLP